MVDRDKDQQKTGHQRTKEREIGERAGRDDDAIGEQRMGNQGSEGSFGGESSGTQSGSLDAGNADKDDNAGPDNGKGQPIGGDDSNTGSGTPLSQGADPGGTGSLRRT